MTNLARAFELILITWLCAFSMADVKGIPDMVLCIGKDGHVELESVLDERCGDRESQAPENLLVPADENHCGECSDVPLFSAATRSITQKLAASPLTGPRSAPALAADQRTPSAAVSAISLVRTAPPSLPSALAAIRTVRLLV